MKTSAAWSKKGLWYGAGSFTGTCSSSPGGSGSCSGGEPAAPGLQTPGAGTVTEDARKAVEDEEARIAAAAAASARVAAAKRWSMGTNSDEDEFEIVLAGEGELTPESVPLSQYKASERSFDEWPPAQHPFVVSSRVHMWHGVSADERQHARELFSRWRLTLARTPPLLERPAPAIRATLDIVMHKGCPEPMRKQVWLALAGVSAAANKSHLATNSQKSRTIFLYIIICMCIHIYTPQTCRTWQPVLKLGNRFSSIERLSNKSTYLSTEL
jgi:hypothetical protein